MEQCVTTCDDLVISQNFNNLFKSAQKSNGSHLFDSENTSLTLNNTCHQTGKVDIKSHILGQQS